MRAVKSIVKLLAVAVVGTPILSGCVVVEPHHPYRGRPYHDVRYVEPHHQHYDRDRHDDCYRCN